jgi:hypothetical protein
MQLISLRVLRVLRGEIVFSVSIKKALTAGDSQGFILSETSANQ